MVLWRVERVGKRIGKADHTIWEGTPDEKKTAGRAKSSHDKAATGTWQSRKKHDIEERQKERISNEKALGTREVSAVGCYHIERDLLEILFFFFLSTR